MGYGIVALIFFGVLAIASVMGQEVKEEVEVDKN